MSDYARKKLWECLYSLVGDGTLKERVASAATGLIVLKSEDFPAELRNRFDELMRALSVHPAVRVGEGSLHASVRRMTDAEAAEWSQEILGLYSDLHGGI